MRLSLIILAPILLSSLVTVSVTILLQYVTASTISSVILVSNDSALANETSSKDIRQFFRPSFNPSIPPPDKFLESKGQFSPPDLNVPTDALFFMAPIGPVNVISDNIKNNSNIIDFDDVPAGEPPIYMRFMPPYQAIYYVYNKDNQDINISSIRLTDVDPKQAQSPFEFCGIDYNKTSIRLSPGHTQEFVVCFYPKITGYSNAILQFYQGSKVLFEVPLRGNGVSPTMSEQGMMQGMNNQINAKNITATEKASNSDFIKKVPSTISNLGSNSQSFMIEPVTDCSVTIEGGGQRPNPAITPTFTATEIDPLTAISIGPPDDGLDLVDNATNHLHKINVGELVKLEAKVSGLSNESIKNIRWTVSDPKIKDYNELMRGKFVTYNLTEQDYLKPAISFYWKDIGKKMVTVSVEGVSNNQSKKCSASRTFSVERNHDDIDRQASDFYTFNHNGALLVNHVGWHIKNAITSPCDPSNNGEEFFAFHKGVISDFNSWRETFGYPKIVAWQPTNYPPKILDSYNVDDVNRDKGYKPEIMPSYLTIEGGNTGSVCGKYVWNLNITKLSDFPDLDHLGSDVEYTWHNHVHTKIGGDMGDPRVSPKDMVFAMWHKNLDLLYDKYRELP